eukprot:1381922-Rhodomonas_salina.2
MTQCRNRQEECWKVGEKCGLTVRLQDQVWPACVHSPRVRPTGKRTVLSRIAVKLSTTHHLPTQPPNTHLLIMSAVKLAPPTPISRFASLAKSCNFRVRTRAGLTLGSTEKLCPWQFGANLAFMLSPRLKLFTKAAEACAV